ncbi:MAG: hypothetical protein M5U25_04850 [Planctomycetota bacterium]|nr:hypothetical protein [Planctomycetota bacterium]
MGEAPRAQRTTDDELREIEEEIMRSEKAREKESKQTTPEKPEAELE